MATRRYIRATAGMKRHTEGSVLLTVTVMLCISMVTVAGIYSYAKSNERLNQRHNDFISSTCAAEASTEKVLAQLTQDFNNYGSGYIQQQLSAYRQLIPSASESPDWANFDFMDLAGALNRVQVDYTPTTTYVPITSKYGPLRAFQDRIRILSNARLRKSLDGVVGSVYQDIQLSRLPVFQYAIFYNVPLQIAPGPDMTVTGPVHCNTNIYLSPGATLTFNSDVTASGNIVMGVDPLSPVAPGSGTVVFNGAYDSGVSTLSLPIGTNNTPAAVHEVLNPPPPLEDPHSSMGQQRYYNEADMIIQITNDAVRVTSGLWDNFMLTLSSNEVATFLATNASFFNKRENKTVQSIDLDVGKLAQWNATNTSLRPTLPLHDVRTIYVADERTLLPTSESGVRLLNGATLPPQGLTVATPSPAYILGNYNASGAALGTTDTSGTLPASIAADAITILSPQWSDSNSTLPLALRNATDCTVNAAFLAGVVATTSASYSGGVENFPRFLENWSGHTFTYNGSMVCMFTSQIATGLWLGTGSPPDIYNAPIRQWALDQNFQYSDKLPPATPSLVVLVRANWRTPAAFTTNIVAGF